MAKGKLLMPRLPRKPSLLDPTPMIGDEPKIQTVLMFKRKDAEELLAELGELKDIARDLNAFYRTQLGQLYLLMRGGPNE
jgi:hypothetical protein